MELIKPDYRKGILSVINAWRQQLGLSVHHPADPQVSAWLADHQWNQIVVLLIDGMGARLLETKLEKDSFLRTHQLKEVTTVYPSNHLGRDDQRAQREIPGGKRLDRLASIF